MENEQSIDDVEISAEDNPSSDLDAVNLNDESETESIVLEEEDILVEDTQVDEPSDAAPEFEGSQWYIVQCYALYEQKVRDRILQMMEDEFKGIIFRVLLPEEETVEIKNNERKEKVKKMFPGYLFVQMKPDEGVWYMLRRLPGVAKLVGTKNEDPFAHAT